jgi:hypothetical protein
MIWWFIGTIVVISLILWCCVKVASEYDQQTETFWNNKDLHDTNISYYTDTEGSDDR